MNVLALLQKNGIDYRKSESFWVRINCGKCDGKQTHTVSLHTVTHFAECHRCGWKGKGQEVFQLLGAKIRAADLSFVEEVRGQTVQDIPDDCEEAWKSKPARTYLQGRKITKTEAEEFGVFFCRSGKFANRIILPIFDHRGNYRTFQARTIVNDEPKYLNPYNANLSHLLYGLQLLFRKHKCVWLVEGCFDCFHLFPYAVASFSKNISEKQIQLLRIGGFQEIVLCWDNDAWEATPEIWESAVQKLSKYFIVQEIKLPYGDPTDFSLLELKGFLRRTLK